MKRTHGRRVTAVIDHASYGFLATGASLRGITVGQALAELLGQSDELCEFASGPAEPADGEEKKPSPPDRLSLN